MVQNIYDILELILKLSELRGKVIPSKEIIITGV